MKAQLPYSAFGVVASCHLSKEDDYELKGFFID